MIYPLALRFLRLSTWLLAIAIPADLLHAQDKPMKIADVDINLSDVYKYFKNDKYGFVIKNAGYISDLHDAAGKIIFRKIGKWSFQGSVENGEGKPNFYWGGELDQKGSSASIDEKVENGKTVFLIQVEHPRMTAKTKIVCLPDGPEMTWDFTVVDFKGEKETYVNLLFGIEVEKENLKADSDFSVVTFPLTWTKPSGEQATVEYESDAYAPYGNGGRASLNGDKGGVTFSPRFPEKEKAGSTSSLLLKIIP